MGGEESTDRDGVIEEDQDLNKGESIFWNEFSQFDLLFSASGEIQEDVFNRSSSPVVFPNSPAISSLQPSLKIHRIASADGSTENRKGDDLAFLQKLVTEHLGNESNFFQFVWGTIQIFTMDHGIMNLGITQFTKLQRSLYLNKIYTREELLNNLSQHKMTFNVEHFDVIIRALDRVFRFRLLDVKGKFLTHKCLLVILWWLDFSKLDSHLKRLQKILAKKEIINFETVSKAMRINMRANNARWRTAKD